MSKSKYTLNYVLKLWTKSSEAQQTNENFEKYLKSALKLYVLPGLDPHAQDLTPTMFRSYCDKLLVDRLKDALTIFDQQFLLAVEAGRVAKSTKGNYRSALGRFIDWVKKQVWWRELFPLDIPDISPKLLGFSEKPKLQPRHESYSLREDQLPEKMIEEIKDLKDFRISGVKRERRRRLQTLRDTRRGVKPKIDQIKESTFHKDKGAILRFLGWYINIEGNSLLDLSINLLTNVDLVEDYVFWLVEERGNSHACGKTLIDAAMAVAKWLNYEKTTRRNWSDIAVIQDLRDLRSIYEETYKTEKKRLEEKKWAHKEMTHEEARKVVQFLRELCAPYRQFTTKRKRYGKETERSQKSKRSPSTIVKAWQTYLIVKIFIYCPVRQQEVRDFRLGKTLFRKTDSNGKNYYVVKLKDHKLDTKTGKSRHYKLPDILTQDLDDWIDIQRPKVVNSIKTLEGWMSFWGDKPDELERWKQRLNDAREGKRNTGKPLRVNIEKHIRELERQIQGFQARIDAWETAKHNIETHDTLFFKFGGATPSSFGTPHDVPSIWGIVTRAVAKATKILFGEERVLWTNPHAFRHISEKHIRKIKGETKSFGLYIGHSEKMGDMYANQITSEYELTEEIADNWWE